MLQKWRSKFENGRQEVRILNEEKPTSSFFCRRSDLQQVLMYPKHLVYPNGESDRLEIQLEMIRAKKYQQDSDSCDMDMTEACPYNITVNVPLIRTVERGNEVHLMKQKTSETAPDPGN